MGMTVATTQGIAGYVYSTGEALALSDVASDPRFDREAAERTGYMPRSIAAVPLVTDDETVGVLQVLDKHSAPSFTMRDMELLAVFAEPGGGGDRRDEGPARPARPSWPPRSGSWSRRWTTSRCAPLVDRGHGGTWTSTRTRRSGRWSTR